MICSSEKRFFTSNLLLVGDWTRNRAATQTRGDVVGVTIFLVLLVGLLFLTFAFGKKLGLDLSFS
jgi:hypothetical protein